MPYTPLPASATPILIDQQDLVTANTFSTAAWPVNAYRAIYVSIVGHVTNVSAVVEFLRLRANSDSGANYNHLGTICGNGTLSGSSAVGDTSAKVGILNTTNPTAFNCQIDLYPFTDGFQRQGHSVSGAIWDSGGAGGNNGSRYDFTWTDTSTSLTSLSFLFSVSATSLFTGRLTVKGVQV